MAGSHDASSLGGRVAAAGDPGDGDGDPGENRDGDYSVVFVSQQYPPDRSGHASRIHDTATALADEGWDVTVLAAPPSFPPGEFDRHLRLTEKTTDDGVTVRRLWTWQPTDPDPGFLSRLGYYVFFAVFATVWVTLVRRRDDVVVTTTPPISTGLAGFPAALLGAAWVVDVRDRWIDASVALGFIAEGGVLERASRWFQSRVLGTADRVAVTTSTLGDALCEQYGAALAARTVLVPNGVDVAQFTSRADGSGATGDAVPGSETPDSTVSDSDATDGGVADDAVADEDPVDDAVADDDPVDDAVVDDDPADPFVVVYTGNIGHAQALDTCVRALEHLPERVVLRLVGGGDAVPRLRRLAAECGVADRVEFVGTVPHERVPAHLAAADVGVAPLADDPELAYAMPTKVYEYCCARLPVVATGRGELERFVERSGGGIHADSDPESVAAAIDRLAGDPDLRATLGRQGCAHVREHYDRAAIARRFSDQLHALVDET